MSMRDDLARLAYVMAKSMPRRERLEIIRGVFATNNGLSEAEAIRLYERGKVLARMDKRRAA